MIKPYRKQGEVPTEPIVSNLTRMKRIIILLLSEIMEIIFKILPLLIYCIISTITFFILKIYVKDTFEAVALSIVGPWLTACILFLTISLFASGFHKLKNLWNKVGDDCYWNNRE